jgi:4-amino-4-deoxy-L-arabinose transferase-like glycosyltransferase
VAVANAMLARAIFRRQLWLGCIGAGVAIGLATMCKGPVSLLQTVMPVGVWWLLLRWMGRQRATTHADDPRTSENGTQRPSAPPWVGSASVVISPKPDSRSRRLLPILGALIAFLVIALPWPILVLTAPQQPQSPGEPPAASVAKLWWGEITREGVTDHDRDPIYSYLNLLPNLMPWLPPFLAGVWFCFRRRRCRSGDTVPPVPSPGSSSPSSDPLFKDPGETTGGTASAARLAAATPRRAHRGYLLALCWLLVPIVIMSVARDKPDRYLLPLLAPAAILAGRGLIAFAAGVRLGRRDARIWLAIPLGTIAVLAAAVPILGTTGFVLIKLDGAPWYGPILGPIALVVAMLLVGAMFRFMYGQQPGRAIALAGLTMLLIAALTFWGYKDSADGRDEMKPIAERIRTLRPGATVGYYDPRKETKPLPPDLLIYLNQPVHVLKRGAMDKSRTTTKVRPPDVVVMLQRESEQPPQVQGWRTIATEPYKGRFWHALVRMDQNDE